jgi:hypothetical protein
MFLLSGYLDQKTALAHGHARHAHHAVMPWRMQISIAVEISGNSGNRHRWVRRLNFKAALMVAAPKKVAKPRNVHDQA